MANFLKMVILGAPGSGKGTISNRLVRDFKLVHMSMGDVLRSHVLKKTELGLQVDHFIRDGQLVPDDLMVKLIGSEIRKIELNSWLLDGYPRTMPQAKVLDEYVNLDVVVNLEVPDEVIADRVKDRWVHLPSGRIYNTIFNPPKVEGKDDVTGEPLIQREDDKPESVLKRLKVYHNNTNPIKEFYRSKGILAEFFGTESNEIYPRVKKDLIDKFPNIA